MRLVLPFTTAIVLTAISAISFARGAELSAGDLVVSAAWARATPPGATVGAAYLTIENRGAEDDRIVSAASPAARSAGLHETIEENGVARMRPLPWLALPAGAKLEMKPGATHVMMMGLARPIAEGDDLTLTLVFEKAGSLTVPVEVAPIGAAAPGARHEDQK